MQNNAASLSAASKLKNRNAYEVHRVDMSQYLPNIKPSQSDFRVPSTYTSRAKPIGNTLKTNKLPKVAQPLKGSNKLSGIGGVGFNEKKFSKKDEFNYIDGRKFPEDPRNPGMYENTANYSPYSNKNLAELRQPATMRRDNSKESLRQDTKQIYQGQATGNINMIEQGIPQSELQGYKFLNQAQVIHVMEESDVMYTDRNEHSSQNPENSELDLAIENLLERTEEERDIQAVLADLDIVLDSNILEQKNSVDYTGLDRIFCEVLLNDSLDLHRKVKIMGFLFFFCEESLFSLSLDFQYIFEAVIKFTLESHTQNWAIVLDETSVSIFDHLNKAWTQLFKYISEQFLIVETERMTMVFDGFLDVFYNFVASVVRSDELYSGSLSGGPSGNQVQHLRSYTRSMITFLKKIEVRRIIQEGKDVHVKANRLLGEVCQLTTKQNNFNAVEPLSMQDNYEGLIISVYNLELYLNIFKYNELYSLQGEGVDQSVEDVIANGLLSLGRFLFKEEIMEFLSKEEDELADGIIFKKERSNIIRDVGKACSCLKDMVNNTKLFEDKKLDFQRILDAVKKF